MEEEGFGHCTNHGACQSACPKDIRVDFITNLNSDYIQGALSAGGEG